MKNRLTERCVELSLAKKWIEKYDGYVEVGAVTPYYDDITPKGHRCIDPCDKSDLVTDRVSIFDVDLTRENVLSISTLEHIGMGEYLKVPENCEDAIDKVIEESKHCFVTVPLAYNSKMDKKIKQLNMSNKNVSIFFYVRGKFDNKWHILYDYPQKISYGPYEANCIAIIEK